MNMMARQAVFITGTDTDVGKTVVSCGLLEKMRQQGFSTLAVKPVASGCELTSEGLRNSDALALSSAMTLPMTYDEVNPVAFEPAIAPHIAAKMRNVQLSSEELSNYCKAAFTHKADFSLIEGAGGWRVPLNDDGSACLSQLPKMLDVSVILVVGVKLGCINHARLTAEAIINDGLSLMGWVANQVDPNMNCVDENIQTLRSIMPGNFLGCIPFLCAPTSEKVAEHLVVDTLFEQGMFEREMMKNS